MSTPKQPGVSVRLRIQRDVGSDDVRYSTRPYAGATFTEGRVRRGGWGLIRRELSDDAGQPRMSTASVLLNDDDGQIREIIAEDPTRFVADTEAQLTVLSEAGRTAGLEERSLLRARVEDAPMQISRAADQRGRSVQLNLVGSIDAYLDRNILQARFLRSDFPDIDRALENTYIPVILGEHSDDGAEDVNGDPADKGMIPAIYVGGLQSINGVAEDAAPPSGSPSFLPPPTLSYTINGTPGTTTRYYGATSLSAVGESVLSAILVVDDAPDVLDGTNSVEITIDGVDGATGYVLYGRRNPTPVRRLKVLGPAVGSPATVTYTDTGVDVEYTPGPPEVNTAQVETEEDGFFWDLYVVALGYVPILKIYASDVARGTEPRRITDPAFVTAGTDFSTSDSPNWPLPNPWYETASGLRLTVFLGRGPRSQHHKEGIVTIAIQTCGREDVGDSTGDSFQEAFPILQHLLNEEVFKNDGEGYRTGLYGPLETWDDGSPATPILQTTKFAACQALTETWLGGSPSNGYKAAVYLREPLTVRQFLQTFCQTFDCFIAVNHHGQLFPVLYDPDADPTAGREYRERIEILRIEPAVRDKEYVEPRIFYQFDYDPDAKGFRSEVIMVQDVTAFEAQQSTLRDPGVKLLRYTRDAATAEDAMERRRDRLKYPRWRQAIVAKYSPALEDEVGDQIRVRHVDGPLGAGGWEGRPFLVTSHVVDANAGEVTLTGYDIYPLLEGGSP